ncbi:MAG TPA: NAD-binding protein, partial [Vicinamibacteria bacterium]|nr:NAD-binding protein [Vicinamibacteria bacterium]
MRVVVAGGGQVGALIARRLSRERNEVVIVEPDPARVRQLEAQLDAEVVQGSASRILTLRRARVADADMLIAVTNSDEANVLACLIAQAEGPVRVKVARIRTYEVD